jgi:hypothetical protein
MTDFAKVTREMREKSQAGGYEAPTREELLAEIDYLVRVERIAQALSATQVAPGQIITEGGALYQTLMHLFATLRRRPIQPEWGPPQP